MERARWFALLVRPFPPEARAALLAEIGALDARLAGAIFDPEAAERLTRARRALSRSLEAPSALAAWLGANARMGDFARDDVALSIARICELNATLRGRAAAGGAPSARSPLRAKPIHVGPYACPSARDVAPLLAPMLDHVAERSRDVHPLAGAALLEQWLLTVHPFDDANGRTARLTTDWFLARAGYPPATYPTLHASLKAIIDHGREPVGVVECARRLVGGVRHTLDLLSL